MFESVCVFACGSGRADKAAFDLVGGGVETIMLKKRGRGSMEWKEGGGELKVCVCVCVSVYVSVYKSSLILMTCDCPKHCPWPT